MSDNALKAILTGAAFMVAKGNYNQKRAANPDENHPDMRRKNCCKR